MAAKWKSSPLSDLQSETSRERADFSGLPFTPIDYPTQRFDGTVRGNYLIIRCIANIDTYASLRIATGGRVAVRYGDTGKFRALGSINGAIGRRASYLQLSVYIEKGPDILTFLCDYPAADEMTVQCTTEFDAVVLGSAKNSFTAYPILKTAIQADLRVLNRLDRPGNAYVYVDQDGKRIVNVKNTGEAYAQFPVNPSDPPAVITLTKTPTFVITGDNTGASQVQLTGTVYPRPF